MEFFCFGCKIPWKLFWPSLQNRFAVQFQSGRISSVIESTWIFDNLQRNYFLIRTLSDSHSLCTNSARASSHFKSVFRVSPEFFSRSSANIENVSDKKIVRLATLIRKSRQLNERNRLEYWCNGVAKVPGNFWLQHCFFLHSARNCGNYRKLQFIKI